MIRKKGVVMIGAVMIMLVIAATITITCSTSSATRVDFTNIKNFDSKKVIIEGFLGESVSLQQILQRDLPVDSINPEYFLLTSGKSADEKIILVLNPSDSIYIEQGAFISVTGKVEIIDSREIYLHVVKISY